ncbi:MAG: 4'-phosphopantetheinyl transferase superfamily protein [Xanthomonadales bacterium]|nr:4'-phosphopantetheinyl transferase superfamily protein [Xanthomonadales bacterium]NIX12635.1 4'-phosphopantetheinyl transferase superfamily protein [Xanthomonadales bacterium]
MTNEEQPTINPGHFQPVHLPVNRLEPPEPGVVHLWYLDLLKLGSPLQPGHAEPLTRITPRQERTIRRFYLRLLLGAYLRLPGKEVSVSRLVRGKPVLDANVHGRALDFSIAGSAACCLIGVCSEGLIGVDLELAGRRTGNPLGLARRYFSESEVEALSSCAGEGLDRAFLHTWACKEAVVKAAGHGIANQLCRFTVSTRMDRRPEVLDMLDDEPTAWRLEIVGPSKRHLGAVALRHDGMKIEAFRLEHRN